METRGRPRKFKTPAELQTLVDAYFADCDPHISTHKVAVRAAQGSGVTWTDEEYVTEQKPYTITGLALALGTDRSTLLEYESGVYDFLLEEDEDNRDETAKLFSYTIKEAKNRCHYYAEQHLYTGKNPTGAIFSLKNNYGWKDQSQIDQHTNGEVIHKYEDMDDTELAAALKARETTDNPEA